MPASLASATPFGPLNQAMSPTIPPSENDLPNVTHPNCRNEKPRITGVCQRPEPLFGSGFFCTGELRAIGREHKPSTPFIARSQWLAARRCSKKKRASEGEARKTHH